MDFVSADKIQNFLRLWFILKIKCMIKVLDYIQEIKKNCRLKAQVLRYIISLEIIRYMINLRNKKHEFY